MEQTPTIKTGYRLVTTKTVFVVTIVVAAVTVLGVWLFGLGRHRTMFENSFISTSVLSVAFFLFLTIGLYNGVKLKDNVGRLTDRLKPSRMPDWSQAAANADLPFVGDGIAGILVSILFWFVMAIVLSLLLWFLGAVVWSSIILFIAMLYWIFFRALRLVFRNSAKCKDNLVKSIGYGLLYTVLYNSWIYAVIFLSHYLADRLQS